VVADVAVALVIVVGPGIVNTCSVDDPNDVPLLAFIAYATTLYVVPDERVDRYAVVAPADAVAVCISALLSIAVAFTLYVMVVEPTVPENVVVALVADVAITLDNVGATGAVRIFNTVDSYDVPVLLLLLVVIAVIAYDLLFANPLKYINDVVEFPHNVIVPLILAYMVYVYPIYGVV
jgi:hypothetical protein